MDYKTEALAMHKQLRGKFSTKSKVKVETREDLSLAYTPGVAAPCEEIHRKPEKVYDYTNKGNMVAVVSDGTAVLGLGDIGPEAAIPVMEGKALLFKEFADVDAVPICLDTTDSEEMIRTIQLMSPSFGGINLEDISSPRCFEIEKKLDALLPIPVFHDDQHGTAIVVTAGVINACKFVDKDLADLKVVVNGPGAAGTAIIHMLLTLGVGDVIVCDEHGILTENCSEKHKKDLANQTNEQKLEGNLETAIAGADIFIGVSVGNILNEKMITSMNEEPIIFAMANPTPEISYEKAKGYGVKVMGTGRSDAPNQVNNLLAFPGIFRGALDARAKSITPEMKLAAAYAIANLIPEDELTEDYIIPDALNRNVSEEVAKAVERSAE